jgi:tetratricopeptide (TPR) repeat protein
MDCRRTVGAAVCLLAGALGCSHDTVGTQPAPLRETAPPPLAYTTSAYAPMNPTTPNTPKRTPQAASCVAGGDYIAGEAAALDKGSAAQEAMFDKARKAYAQAISIDPNCVSAYQSLARLYVQMDDFDHATATYRRALQIEPRNGAIWFALGWTQARHKEWPAAIDALSHAVEYDRENRQYVNTLAFALACTGQYQASLACFSRQYNEAVSQYQLARMLHHLQQYDQCRQYLQSALQKDPNLEPARALLAQLGAPTPVGAVRTISYTEDLPPDFEQRQQGSAPQPAELPQQTTPARRILLPPPTGDWQNPGR